MSQDDSRSSDQSRSEIEVRMDNREWEWETGKSRLGEPCLRRARGGIPQECQARIEVRVEERQV